MNFLLLIGKSKSLKDFRTEKGSKGQQFIAFKSKSERKRRNAKPGKRKWKMRKAVQVKL